MLGSLGLGAILYGAIGTFLIKKQHHEWVRTLSDYHPGVEPPNNNTNRPNHGTDIDQHAAIPLTENYLLGHQSMQMAENYPHGHQSLQMAEKK